MKTKLLVQEILNSIPWLENIGHPIGSIINFNVQYIDSKDSIKRNIYSDHWANIDLLNFNSVLVIFDKMNNSNDDKLNQIAIDVNEEFSKFQNEFKKEALSKKITTAIVVHFKENLIRAIQEKFVNENFEGNFNFFNDNLEIFKSGNISCGWSGVVVAELYDPFELRADNIKNMINGSLLVY